MVKIRKGISGLGDLTRYGDVHSDRGVSRSYIPPVQEGSYEDLTLDEELQAPLLENYVVDTEENMFFTDDHNHALAGWIAATYEGLTQGETVLLHVDFHEDMKQPPEYLHTVEEDGYNLQVPDEIPLSMNEVNKVVPDLQINEFIEPALEWGLFDELQNQGLREKTDDGYKTDVESFQNFDAEEYDNVIADIDIDFYLGLDGDRHRYSREQVEEVERKVAETVSEADFVTWATSPGFMDQEEAVEKIGELVELSQEV